MRKNLLIATTLTTLMLGGIPAFAAYHMSSQQDRASQAQKKKDDDYKKLIQYRNLLIAEQEQAIEKEHASNSLMGQSSKPTEDVKREASKPVSHPKQSEAPVRKHHEEPSRSDNSQDLGHGWRLSYYNSGGITKSGAHTEDGVTIAVDPRYIPLGSKVRVTFPSGKVIERIAQDTGGAIHGKRLDLYVDASDSETSDLGVIRNCRVEIEP